MRVLVTGGCGYVGSHAGRELTAAGHEVVLYDNLSTGHRGFSEGYEFIEADIADKVQLAKVLQRTERCDALRRFSLRRRIGRESAKILPQ
jgi:UDP-glucose 4-epimerase